MSQVLVIDDEPSIGWAFREFLGDLGHRVELASSAEEGMKKAAAAAFDAVLLDIRLPGIDGLSALAELKARVAPAPIIVITAFGNLETAVSALEGGAFDYLVKPFDLDQAGEVVLRAIEASRHRPGSGENPAHNERETPGSSTLIGRSPAMQQLFKQIALVAPTDAPVLITGESGTGKELVARAIHQHSPRRDRTLLPVNLTALNPGLIERELFGHVRGSFTGADQSRKGLLELAGGGTLLLDEIGDVPLPVQVKLLRAIEHREITPVGDARPQPIDVRFLAATNRPLADQIAAGEFRHDLFFRLSVFPIHVPPLRDRRDDIPELARYFLKRLNPDGGDVNSLREDVTAALMARPWPGNVRELRNAVERAAIVARGRAIRPEHLPPPPDLPAMASSSGSIASRELIQEHISRWTELVLQRASVEGGEPGSLYEPFLELVEPPFLKAVLSRSQGHRAEAAQQIGIHRATLRQKLRKYGLE
jgi:two-component system nitrogen regulation response regulator GlnG